MLCVLLVEYLVAVPVADAFTTGLVSAVEKLHKAHAFFEQATGKDAVLGKTGLDRAGGVLGPLGL